MLLHPPPMHHPVKKDLVNGGARESTMYIPVRLRNGMIGEFMIKRRLGPRAGCCGGFRQRVELLTLLLGPRGGIWILESWNEEAGWVAGR